MPSKIGERKQPVQAPVPYSEQELYEVAKYQRMGYSPTDMVKLMGCSRNRVNGLLKRVRENYAEATLVEYDAFVAEQVEMIRDIRKEAWEAWHRSKADSYKEVVDYYNELVDGDDEDEKRVESKEGSKRVTREGRLPECPYLRLIMDTLTEERILRGFQKPPNNSNLNVTVNLTELYNRETEVVDPIEEKIKQVRALNPANNPPGIKLGGEVSDAEFVVTKVEDGDSNGETK